MGGGCTTTTLFLRHTRVTGRKELEKYRGKETLIRNIVYEKNLSSIKERKTKVVKSFNIQTCIHFPVYSD